MTEDFLARRQLTSLLFRYISSPTSATAPAAASKIVFGALWFPALDLVHPARPSVHNSNHDATLMRFKNAVDAREQNGLKRQLRTLS